MIAKRSVKTVSKAFTVIGTAALYTALPDELIKELSTKEGRKEMLHRIREKERQRKLMKQHQ